MGSDSNHNTKDTPRQVPCGTGVPPAAITHSEAHPTLGGGRKQSELSTPQNPSLGWTVNTPKVL